MDPTEVRREWAERAGAYSPAYYAYHGPDSRSEAVREVLERVLEPGAAVLELGCGSGRHLAHLLENGFTEVTGIELNDDARAVMRDTFPDLAATGTFHFAPIEETIRELPTDGFDAAFSVETFQHLHPESGWVFDELIRVTSGLVITVENEGPAEETRRREESPNYVNGEVPLYYRNWERVFSDRGLVEIESRRLDRNTVRVFRIPDE